MDGTEVKKFFGEVPELWGEKSVENCLRIFDENQAKMEQFLV